jgi:selenocysteine-specific elongation factor
MANEANGAHEEPRPLIVGTAGHIDHGKTALVGALTGVDTDRLVEERRRGISIELGFAELVLPDGRSLGIIDVPGHERLVRTMVAGASGIDLFLLVVAADDGPMPQTHEHLTVLRGLGVEDGVIAVTKCDAAPDESRELVLAEAPALWPGAPVVAVSARTGAGLDELRAALAEVAEVAAERAGGRAEDGAPTVLHADRAFTLRGIGTVVTGTLGSGAIRRGDRLEVIGRRRRVARARAVEVHGRERDLARAGERVAVNLAGIERSDVEPGSVIADPAAGLRESFRLDVHLDSALDGAALGGRRLQVHHGTRDAPARVVLLSDDGLVQLRLERSLAARRADRVVLRRIAPPDTLGGATVLDPAPRRHGPGPATERLRRLRAGEAGSDRDADRGAADAAAAEGGAADAGAAAAAAERPPRPLGERELLVLALLRRDRFSPRSPPELAQAIGVGERSVSEALDVLAAHGALVRLDSVIAYPADVFAEAERKVRDAARTTGSISLAELRDALGTSRKYAQAILERLDSEGVLVRHGDRHVLRRPRG